MKRALWSILTSVLVACSAVARDGEDATPTDREVQQIVAALGAVPRGGLAWLGEHLYVTPDDASRLKRLVRLSPSQAQRLSRSDAPRELCVAMFVLGEQGDVKSLLRLARANIANPAEGIPYAVLCEGLGAPVKYERQMMYQYAGALLEEWFGVDVNVGDPRKRLESFDKYVPGNPDFPNAEAFAYPWVRRLSRARLSAEGRGVGDVERAIRSLPETVQAVVVTIAFNNETYDEASAREFVRGLSAEVRDRLASGPDAVPIEPYIEEKKMRERICERFRILSAPPR